MHEYTDGLLCLFADVVKETMLPSVLQILLSSHQAGTIAQPVERVAMGAVRSSPASIPVTRTLSRTIRPPLRPEQTDIRCMTRRGCMPLVASLNHRKLVSCHDNSRHQFICTHTQAFSFENTRRAKNGCAALSRRAIDGICGVM